MCGIFNKKKCLLIMAVLLVLGAAYLLNTVLVPRNDVHLANWQLSTDGTQLTMQVNVPNPVLSVRDFADKGGGVKPHYLHFYAGLGKSDRSLRIEHEFVLDLQPDDAEIYFYRGDGGYELVLQKNEAGEWHYPENY